MKRRCIQAILADNDETLIRPVTIFEDAIDFIYPDSVELDKTRLTMRSGREVCINRPYHEVIPEYVEE